MTTFYGLIRNINFINFKSNLYCDILDFLSIFIIYYSADVTDLVNKGINWEKRTNNIQVFCCLSRYCCFNYLDVEVKPDHPPNTVKMCSLNT